jgi:hypothetical protein
MLVAPMISALLRARLDGVLAQCVAPEPAARESLVSGLCASLSAAQIAEMVEKVELSWRQGSQA